MKDFTTIAKGLFDSHPTVNRWFFSSDGQAFKLQQQASEHGKGLNDKTVTEVFRPGISEEHIKEFKASEAAEANAGLLTSFRRANPELSKIIESNTAKKPTF